MRQITLGEQTVDLDSLEPFNRGVVMAANLMIDGSSTDATEYLSRQIAKIGRTIGKPAKQRIVIGRADGDTGPITHAEKVAVHPSVDDIGELAGFASAVINSFYVLASATDKAKEADASEPDTNTTKEQ